MCVRSVAASHVLPPARRGTRARRARPMPRWRRLVYVLHVKASAVRPITSLPTARLSFGFEAFATNSVDQRLSAGRDGGSQSDSTSFIHADCAFGKTRPLRKRNSVRSTSTCSSCSTR
jgi:hypothetical protein